MRYHIRNRQRFIRSMERRKEKGDQGWELFHAILHSASYEEYMEKVGDTSFQRISEQTGQPWVVNADNAYKYLVRKRQIEEIEGGSSPPNIENLQRKPDIARTAPAKKGMAAIQPKSTDSPPVEKPRIPVKLFQALKSPKVKAGMIEVQSICMESISCRSCFHGERLNAAEIDIAQPRWIGASYWNSDTRVVLVMLNPGSGNQRKDSSGISTRGLLNNYAGGSATLNDVFRHQRKDMPSWGRGRFMRFIESGMNLDLDKIALMNLAWCATRENSYPNWMLESCFRKHGLRLLQALDPKFVLLCGNNTHGFASEIHASLPTCEVISTMHYAHRSGAANEAKGLLVVRKRLRS